MDFEEIANELQYNTFVQKDDVDSIEANVTHAKENMEAISVEIKKLEKFIFSQTDWKDTLS